MALKSAGFSFVEALVAVALLALVVLVALPQLFRPAELDAELAARQVGADMQLARRLAIARRATFVVVFTPPAGPYTAYEVRPPAGPPEPGFPKALPAPVTVSGTQQTTFLPSGAATAGASLTFAAGSATAQIDVVAATGHIRVTVP